MTHKKISRKVAKYLRKTYGVPFVDSLRMGKKFAKNYSFDNSMMEGVGILTALAEVSSFDENFGTIFKKYFKVECSFHYDGFYEEVVKDYEVLKLC